MVFQVILAALAMAALQDAHASRLKTSTLVENSGVDDDGPTELDQRHVTQSGSKAIPGTIPSESSQLKEMKSFADSHDSTESIDAFSSSLAEMTPRYGLNESKMDQAAPHPGCGKESTCACAQFYDLLVKHCKYAEEDKEDSEGASECDALVRFLWKDEVPPGHGNKTERDWRKWGYQVLLKTFRDKEKIFGGANVRLLAGFWTGYSWTIGTRQVLDRAIDSKLNVQYQQWHLEDIEYPHHRIGAVMRHLKWDRRCHQSGHDSKLWLSLSKAYAEGTSEDAQGFSPPVVVFINKAMSGLDKSFLFKHELELMTDFSEIILVDYKNECNSQLIDLVKARNNRGISVSCLKGGDQTQMGKLFRDAKGVARLANDIKLLEAGYAPGIKWDLKEKAPMYAEKRKPAASFTECQNKCDQWQDCNLFSYDRHNKDQECEMFHRESELRYEYVSETIISGRSRRKESCATYTCHPGSRKVSHNFSQKGNCCEEWYVQDGDHVYIKFVDTDLYFAGVPDYGGLFFGGMGGFSGAVGPKEARRAHKFLSNDHTRCYDNCIKDRKKCDAKHRTVNYPMGQKFFQLEWLLDDNARKHKMDGWKYYYHATNCAGKYMNHVSDNSKQFLMIDKDVNAKPTYNSKFKLYDAAYWGVTCYSSEHPVEKGYNPSTNGQFWMSVQYEKNLTGRHHSYLMFEPAP